MGTPARDDRPSGRKSNSSDSFKSSNGSGRGGKGSADHEILFQNYFKSVGPRTYAAQVKKANNGNHYLVLTEGKRDEKTDEVWKTRLFIYSEDFVEFFKMLKGASEFIKAHPVSPEVARKRKQYYARKAGADAAPGGAKGSPDRKADPVPAPSAPSAPPAVTDGVGSP